MTEQVDNTVTTLPEDKTVATLPLKEEITPEKAAADTKKKVVKKAKSKKKGGVHTLISGIKVKFHPVAANVMVDAQGRIPDPLMRTYKDTTTGKDEPNPGHPEYLKELADVKTLRAKAAMDVMVLFGLELLDPVPEENKWLDMLKFAKIISDEDYTTVTTEGGEFLRELFYKKYVVVDAFALGEISKLTGVTEEMLASSRKSFPSN